MTKDDYFAKLLRPKNVLCDQRFELQIDDTIFIGFPSILVDDMDIGADEEYRTAPSTLSRPDGSTVSSSSSRMASSTSITMFNLVFVINAKDYAAEQPQNIIVHQEGSKHPGATTPSETVESAGITRAHTSGRTSTQYAVPFLNDLQTVKVIFADAANKLANCIRHEQARCSYLSEQVKVKGIALRAVSFSTRVAPRTRGRQTAM